MGIWSTIKKIGKKAFGVGKKIFKGASSFLDSGLGGAVTSLGGSLLTSALSGKRAQAQRGWQEDMRGTSYQATMEDMRKAGLNPMLAYKQGGTGAGQGQQAMTPDFGASIATGRQAGSSSALRKQQQTLAGKQLEVAEQNRRNLVQEFDKGMGTAQHSRVLAEYYRSPEGIRTIQRNAAALSGGRIAAEGTNLISDFFGEWPDAWREGRRQGRQQRGRPGDEDFFRNLQPRKPHDAKSLETLRKLLRGYVK